MSELPDLRVDPLPDARVKISGLTAEPIEFPFERLKALVYLCTKSDDDSEDDHPLSEEFMRNLGEEP